MTILLIFPYPIKSAASQRFRFEQYLEFLEESGMEYDLSPFLSEKSWRIFYKKGFLFKKALALLKGITKRTFQLFGIWKYDFVFIHREASPIGPPIFEWLIAKVFRKKIIFDFDDAIWISNSSESNRFFARLKWHSNVFKIAKWSYRVSVGNEYLKTAVEEFNKDVVINPTTIDTNKHHNQIARHDNEKLTIGWTGSHSTNRYLDSIFPTIRKLKEEFYFNFIVISDEAPSSNKDLFEYIHWNRDTEIEDLMKINIGIMPLSHDPWSEGKCGFKALQYMALGIPALVSPVGVNEEIVTHGVNGFVCKEESDWIKYLGQLLKNKDALREMGEEARKKILCNYSVESNKANFIHLFA